MPQSCVIRVLDHEPWVDLSYTRISESLAIALMLESLPCSCELQSHLYSNKNWTIHLWANGSSNACAISLHQQSLIHHMLWLLAHTFPVCEYFKKDSRQMHQRSLLSLITTDFWILWDLKKNASHSNSKTWLVKCDCLAMSSAFFVSMHDNEYWASAGSDLQLFN